MRGCEGDAESPAVLGGETWDTCPRRLILDEPHDFNTALHYYKLYDKGILMFDGGVADQPPDYMQLMRIISSAVGEVEAELYERANSKK